MPCIKLSLVCVDPSPCPHGLRRTFTAAAIPRWTVRQISGGAARLIQSRCGGRQLPDECLKQPPPPAGCLSLVAGVSRRPQLDCMRATAPSSAEGQRHALGVVAARGVRAWCWSFFCWLPPSHGLAQVCLHQGGTFRCAATRARALSRECSRAPVGHCLAGWGMGYGSKDSLMSLSYP